MIRPALTMLALFSVLTGLIYPLAMTALGQLLFPAQANGSLIEVNGKIVGSSLIGQSFTDPKYFSSRPSATAAFPYDASASSGSNLGPLHPALLEAMKTRDPAMPIELVTASGSGLDPHISPEGALYQAERVAKTRGLSIERVRALIAEHTKDRTLSIWGEPRVNVLELNLALELIQKTR